MRLLNTVLYLGTPVTDLGLPGWMDQFKASRMVQLRALGYNQTDIARELGVSQGTVSRYLNAVNQTARGEDDPANFLVGLIAIAAGAALAAYLLGRK